MEPDQAIVDVSSTDSPFARYAKEGAKIRLADVEAEKLDLKVGTLKVELDARGFGTITVDGKKLVCNSLSIQCKAGEIPQIQLGICPFTPGELN